MTPRALLHNPTRASVQILPPADGRARLAFTADDGNRVDIYTTPDAAEAVAAAFNGSRKYCDPATIEEREGTA